MDFGSFGSTRGSFGGDLYSTGSGGTLSSFDFMGGDDLDLGGKKKKKSRKSQKKEKEKQARKEKKDKMAKMKEMMEERRRRSMGMTLEQRQAMRLKEMEEKRGQTIQEQLNKESEQENESEEEQQPSPTPNEVESSTESPLKRTDASSRMLSPTLSESSMLSEGDFEVKTLALRDTIQKRVAARLGSTAGSATTPEAGDTPTSKPPLSGKPALSAVNEQEPMQPRQVPPSLTTPSPDDATPAAAVGTAHSPEFQSTQQLLGSPDGGKFSEGALTGVRMSGISTISGNSEGRDFGFQTGKFQFGSEDKAAAADASQAGDSSAERSNDDYSADDFEDVSVSPKKHIAQWNVRGSQGVKGSTDQESTTGRVNERDIDEALDNTGTTKGSEYSVHQAQGFAESGGPVTGDDDSSNALDFLDQMRATQEEREAAPKPAAASAPSYATATGNTASTSPGTITTTATTATTTTATATTTTAAAPTTTALPAASMAATPSTAASSPHVQPATAAAAAATTAASHLASTPLYDAGTPPRTGHTTATRTTTMTSPQEDLQSLSWDNLRSSTPPPPPSEPERPDPGPATPPRSTAAAAMMVRGSPMLESPLALRRPGPTSSASQPYPAPPPSAAAQSTSATVSIAPAQHATVASSVEREASALVSQLHSVATQAPTGSATAAALPAASPPPPVAAASAAAATATAAPAQQPRPLYPSDTEVQREIEKGQAGVRGSQGTIAAAIAALQDIMMTEATKGPGAEAPDPTQARLRESLTVSTETAARARETAASLAIQVKDLRAALTVAINERSDALRQADAAKRDAFQLRVRVRELEKDMAAKGLAPRRSSVASSGADEPEVVRLRRELEEAEHLIQKGQEENKKLMKRLEAGELRSADVAGALAEENRQLKREVERPDIDIRRSAAALQRELETDKQLRGLQEEFAEAKRTWQQREGEMRVELNKARARVRDLEGRTQGIDVRKLSSENSAVQRLEKQVEELKAKHAEELHAVQSQLDWYVENQDMLDRDAAALSRYKSEIALLKRRLAAAEDTVVSAVEQGTQHGKVVQEADRVRSAKDVSRIKSLESQLKQLQKALLAKHPDSVAALISATNASEDGTEESQLWKRHVEQLEKEAEEREQEFDRRLRQLRVEHERLKRQYNRKVQDANKEVASLKDKLSKARKVTTKTGAADRVKDLEKELERVRTFYRRKVAKLQNEKGAHASKHADAPAPKPTQLRTPQKQRSKAGDGKDREAAAFGQSKDTAVSDVSDMVTSLRSLLREDLNSAVVALKEVLHERGMGIERQALLSQQQEERQKHAAEANSEERKDSAEEHSHSSAVDTSPIKPQLRQAWAAGAAQDPQRQELEAKVNDLQAAVKQLTGNVQLLEDEKQTLTQESMRYLEDIADLRVRVREAEARSTPPSVKEFQSLAAALRSVETRLDQREQELREVEECVRMKYEVQLKTLRRSFDEALAERDHIIVQLQQQCQKVLYT